MRHTYDDGGRAAAGFKGSAGDCVARSVAIASGRPYAEVYTALSKVEGSRRGARRAASARSGVHVKSAAFKRYMLSLGFAWTPTMAIGSGCTVHLAGGELPMGRLVVQVSKHLTAVVDGVIHDTHDPSDRPTTIYSPNTAPAEVPKGARLLDNGNGWAYAPKRCVYGYWSLA